MRQSTRRVKYEQLEPRLAMDGSLQLCEWHNTSVPEDVDGDGVIGTADAFAIIFDLNARGTRTLGVPNDRFIGNQALDVNDDGLVSPSDVLNVVNILNVDTPDRLPDDAFVCRECGNGSDAVFQVYNLRLSFPFNEPLPLRFNAESVNMLVLDSSTSGYVDGDSGLSRVHDIEIIREPNGPHRFCGVTSLIGYVGPAGKEFIGQINVIAERDDGRYVSMSAQFYGVPSSDV